MHTSRHVVLLWCLWLLGSWGVSLWRYNLTQASQLMMLAMMVGLMLIWPVYRLGERPESDPEQEDHRPALHAVVLLDWMSLLIVCQAVFWPLKLVNEWPWPQALWLNGSLAAWSLAAGLMIVWGRSIDAMWSRFGAMLMCILIAFGGAIWLAGRACLENGALPSDIMQYGPLTGIWVMAHEPSIKQQGLWQGQTMMAAAAAILGWIGLAVIRMSLQAGHSPISRLDES